MKKLISAIIIVFVVSSIFFSCQKTEPNIINDTPVINDSVIIGDTSEFDYLFKHYELGVYDLLFYTINKQKNPNQICMMNSNAYNIDIITEGYRTYPIWDEVDDYIFYVDFGRMEIIRKYIGDGIIPDSTVAPIDRNVQFLWHQNYLEVFLFSYPSGGSTRIAALDYKTGEIIELTNNGQFEANPVSSRVDDWIYYSFKQNGTWDIFRKKIDGSSVEAVYENANYNLITFNISADGKFLITPKFKEGKGVVVFYDINRHSIIHELELPVDGHPMYASLSKDNKAIFFVNGTPYNYSEPRNLYRMALDRTQLFQLTQYDDKLASRPLVK